MKLKTKIFIAYFVVLIFISVILSILLPNIVYNSTREKDRDTAMNLNEQLVTRVDTYFRNLEKFAAVIESDQTLYDMIDTYLQSGALADYAKIELYLSNLDWKNQMDSYQVLGIYMKVGKTEEERVELATVGLAESLKEQITAYALPKFYQKDNSNMLIDPFKAKSSDTKTIFGNTWNMDYGYISAYNLKKLQGDLVIISSYDQIASILKNLDKTNCDYVILNEDNETIYPSNSDIPIEVNEILKQIQYGESYLEGYQYEDDGIFTVRFSEYGKWKLICFESKSSIISNNRSLIHLNEWLLSILGILSVLFMIPIINSFTQPLSKLSAQMKKVSKGHFDTRVNVTSKDEIGALGNSFNYMSQELQKYVTELIEKEKLEQKMKYGLFVSQIDPHFIYNTMNTISYLAQKGQNQDVISVNKAMIEILKDRLRIGMDHVYDTVEQEISIANEYLTIQHFRYQDIFKAEIDVEDLTRSMLIPKNLLQPLVENALFHGILENLDEHGECLGGCIYIHINVQDSKLFIEVRDNGKGMSPDTLANLSKENPSNKRGTHIGIQNIRERIRLIFQNDGCMSIETKLDSGTKILLQLPIITEESRIYPFD